MQQGSLLSYTFNREAGRKAAHLLINYRKDYRYCGEPQDVRPQKSRLPPGRYPHAQSVVRFPVPPFPVKSGSLYPAGCSVSAGSAN